MVKERVKIIAIVLMALFIVSMYNVSPNKVKISSSPSINKLHGNNVNMSSYINSIERNLSYSLKSMHLPKRFFYMPNFNAMSPENPADGPVYSGGPAPYGIADYGISNSGRYVLDTPSFEGILNLSSFSSFYSGYGTNDVLPDYASVQLNTVLENVTVMGNGSYSFWTQNVIWFNGKSLQFVDNIWNISSIGAVMYPNPFYKYDGSIVSNTFYYSLGPEYNITYPFTLSFYNNVTVENNMDSMYFNYSLAYGGKVYHGSYDHVLFNSLSSIKINPPYFQVNGYKLGANDLPIDAELIFGGIFSGATTTITNISGYDTLKYLSYSSYKTITSAYNVGSDTGESCTGISTWWGNLKSSTVEYLGSGPSFVTPLWNTPGGTQSGYINIKGKMKPSYAFMFVSNNPSVQYNAYNFSYAPTSNGNFSFNLSPGNYELLLVSNGFAPYFYNVSTNISLILTMSPEKIYYTPFYLYSNSELKEMSQDGLINGNGSEKYPYIISNLSITLSPLFTYLNDYFYPSFIAVQICNVSANMILYNVSVTNNIYFVSYYYRTLNMGYPFINLFFVYSSSNITLCHLNVQTYSYYKDNNIISAVMSNNIKVSNNNFFIPSGDVGVMFAITNVSYILNNTFDYNNPYFSHTYLPQVFLLYSSNDTIYNNNFTKNSIGITDLYGRYNNISSNSFFDDISAIVINNTQKDTIYKNYFLGNYQGINSTTSEYTLISNNSMYSDQIDIYYIYTNNTYIFNNTLYGSIGFNFSSSKYNYIYNNMIMAYSNIAYNLLNYWNISEKKGTNIIGGPYIGGNYWASYNCANESNGFGVIPFNDFNSIYKYDYLPLVHTGVPIFFNESGLKANSVWGVKMGNITKYSEGQYIVFHIPPTLSKLNYSVYAPQGYMVSYDKYMVNGTTHASTIAQTIFIKFFLEYNLIISETGLPFVLLPWKFNITTNNLSWEYYVYQQTFYLPIINGTYNISIIPVIGYISTPSNKSITINGSSETLKIIFNTALDVYFEEMGLPKGTKWYVKINNTTKSSTSEMINFSLLPSIYNYTISSNGYVAEPQQGTLNLTNIPLGYEIINVSFMPVYNVTIMEYGLQNIQWSVSINGHKVFSNSSKIEFPLPNGTYKLSVEPVNGYVSNISSENFTVNGKNLIIHIQFTKIQPAQANYSIETVIISVGSIVIIVLIAILLTSNKKGTKKQKAKETKEEKT
ncbi:MAG: thermopsin family protease [Thermoplasmata archaeon]